MALYRHSFEATNTKKKSRLKAVLLAGTALVGIGLFPSMPRSATITYTNGEDDTMNYTLSEASSFETVVGGDITAEQSGTLDLNGFAASLRAMDLTDRLTFSGVISGSGGVSITGSGIIILSGTNTYTGGKTIDSGTLRLLNSAGAGVGTITFNGGVLALGDGVNNANALDLNADATLATLPGEDETATQSGAINTSADSSPHVLTVNAQDAEFGTDPRVPRVPNAIETNATETAAIKTNATETADTLTISGVISGSGSLIIDGPGTVVLSATNTFTGGTTINDGTLQLLNSAGAGVGTITFNGATLALGDGVNNANALDLNADATLATLPGGDETATQSGAINTSADSNPHVLTVNAQDTGSGGPGLPLEIETLAIETAAIETPDFHLPPSFVGDNLTISGVISGSGSLAIDGQGTVILSATNTYSGGTTIIVGTLELSNAAAAGTGPITFFDNDRFKILDLNNVTIANNISALASSPLDLLSQIVVDDGDASGITGAIDLSGDVGFDISASSTLAVSGNISGSEAIIKNGSGTLILSGSNTYSGGTTLTSGTLTLQGGSALSDTGALTVNGGTLQLDASEGIGPLSGTAGVISLGASTLTLNQSAFTTYSGTITGTGSLIKDGTGTLVLSGSSTYSGGTTINDGTVRLLNSASAGVGTITVNSSSLTLGDGVNLANALDMTADSNLSTAIGGNITATHSGTLTLSGEVTLNASAETDSFTFSGVISGTGGLIINGTGNFIIPGLPFNTGEVTPNSTTAIVISRKSGLSELNGSGTVTFSGSNTYSGGTAIVDGTLALSHDSAAGTGTISFVDASDPPSLDIVGNPILDLNNVTIANNISVDITNVAAHGGQIVVDNGDSSGITGAIFLSNNMNFNISASSTLVVSGNVSGSGSMEKNGLGTLILSGTNTNIEITTSLVLVEGTVQLNSSTAAGAGRISIHGSGDAVLALSGGLTFANNFTLFSSLMVTTLSGGTEVSILSGDIAPLFSSASTVTFNTIDGADILTASGVISDDDGTLSLVKTGPGTLILSGSNTYSGGTTLTAGTLTLQGGSALSDTGTVVVNGGTLQLDASEGIGTLSGTAGVISLGANILTVNQSASGTYSGTITGTGGLTKDGTATLTLSGINTYTGSTAINGGTLLNNGSLTSDITIALGATYGGTGTLTGNISTSGTVAPGASIGTTTVTGTVTFNSGSSLDVEFDASGNGDLLDVTGSVTINSGATMNGTLLGASFSGQMTYTIIDTTGGVAGTFDSLLFTNAFGFLTYGSNTVTLTAGALGSTFIASATTPNQSAIANALDGLDPNIDADFGTIFVDYLMLGSAAQATALDQMSGEGLGTLSSSTLATNDLRTQGIASHLNDARLNRSEGTAARASGTRYAQGGGGASVEYGKGVLWMQGYGGKATMDVGGGSFDAAGIDIGYDTWLGDDLLIGVTVGVARDRETGFANLASAEAEYINFGGHMALDSEPVYFHGIFAVGIGDFATTRNIVFGTTNRTAMGSFDGLNATFYGEAGTDGRSGDYTFQPYVALNYSYIERDGYTETGAGSLNLVVAKESLHSLQGILGVRAGTTWQAGDNMTIRPEIRARWVHELANGDMRRSMVNFVGSSASFATINDAVGFGDAFVFGTSFDISTGGSFHIVIGGDYLLSDEYDMWSGTGRVLWNF
ncbi:MAG: autotransporter domain-containing protein [Alphaproteobacteria bacterium]|nr:MAG: autotransporter domain-containing protein [Alphaproteobacteria bacterium]